MSFTLETYNGVRFLRLPIINLSATVRQASWMPKSASYEAFGTVSYSVSADTAQHITSSLGLPEDVNVGIATRASFDDVQAINGKLALPANAGRAFTVRGNATVTVGVNPDDSPRTSVDKNGKVWVNLTLVFSEQNGEWVDRPSSLATTARLVASM
jgi:hypothetical protein